MEEIYVYNCLFNPWREAYSPERQASLEISARERCLHFSWVSEP